MQLGSRRAKPDLLFEISVFTLDVNIAIAYFSPAGRITANREKANNLNFRARLLAEQ